MSLTAALDSARSSLMATGIQSSITSRNIAGASQPGYSRKIAVLETYPGNGVYVAAINRVGHEGPNDGGLEFWGGSFVSDPFGRILKRASPDREEIVIVACRPAEQEEIRRNWPFLRDRRIDAYGDITRRFID